MIQDRIVFGVASAKIRGKLINEGKDFTLDKAIEIGESFEYSQEQLKSMENGRQSSTPSTLGRRPVLEPLLEPVVKSLPNKTKDPPNRSMGDIRTHSGKRLLKVQMEDVGIAADLITQGSHVVRRAKTCDNCNKWNHFSAVYWSNVKLNEVTAKPDYGGGAKVIKVFTSTALKQMPIIPLT